MAPSRPEIVVRRIVRNTVIRFLFGNRNESYLAGQIPSTRRKATISPR